MKRKSYKEMFEKQSEIAKKVFDENVKLKEKLRKEMELNELLLEKIGGMENENIKRRIRTS